MAASRSAFVTIFLPIVFWLLFVVVRPVRADDTTTVVDNTDPGIKALQGHWIHFTGKEYYNGTETLTKDANATSAYNFTGTGISVFGTQCDPPGGNTTVSTYAIDGGAPSKYTVPDGVTCNQDFVKFYTSPPLPNGPHTLLITNLNEGAWYFLDYLEVTSPAPTSSASTALAPTSTPPTLAQSTSAKSNAIDPGVIAAIVLSAVVLLGMSIFGMFLWRRKGQRPRSLKSVVLEIGDEALGPANVTPYRPFNQLPTEEQTRQPVTNSKVTYISGDFSPPPVTANTSTGPTSSYSHTSINQMLQLQDATAAVVDPPLTNYRQSVAATIPPPYER